MKKLLLNLSLVSLCALPAAAQLSQGGIPQSRLSQAIETVTIPVLQLDNPNNNAAEEDLQQQTGAYLVARTVTADWGFPESGIMTEAPDGTKIWRSTIHIQDAGALGMYYDRFQLPQGVQMFITNANGKQILGAYTNDNNKDGGKFATEAVQGGAATIELNINPGAAINDISLHAYKVAAYFRGYEYLRSYAMENLHEIDAIDTILSFGSSVCMINAVCDYGNGYEAQRNASVQQLLPSPGGVSACSGTMVNATGNTAESCKQYMLTATHCDPSNSTSSSDFEEIIIRFNFMQETCEGTAIPSSNTLTGANFVARADYNASAPATSIIGDFMLLELQESIPVSWGINLSGWNNDPEIATTAATGKKFIGFHHPDADMKKVSGSNTISSEALGAPESHWATVLTTGLVSTGSSGSALFNGDGYAIGIASVAGPFGVDAECTVNADGESVAGTSDFVMYSKLSYVWEYSVDGDDDMRRLKPWLDAANTGAVSIEAVKSDCSALDGSTSISSVKGSLEGNFTLYPNPVKNGYVVMQANFPTQKNLAVEVVDITGKTVKAFKIAAAKSGEYTLGLNGLQAGIYLVRVNDGLGSASKKIVIP